MSETTPKDHLIILRELLTGNKTLASSSSIRARVNGSRVRVNCSRTSVKLHLSCTVPMAGSSWSHSYVVQTILMKDLIRILLPTFPHPFSPAHPFSPFHLLICANHDIKMVGKKVAQNLALLAS